MRRGRSRGDTRAMSTSPFADLRGLPYYDEPSLYMNLSGMLWAWEFEGWKPESLSRKTGCHIHGGLSNMQTIFRGPDVREFFSSIAVNSFENFDDVIDIYASLLQPGEEYKTIDLPTSPPRSQAGQTVHADQVLKDGRPIGVSSGTIYSYWFRQVMSMGSIAVEEAQIGNEVVVQWGDRGGRIKDVRATVERYPCISDERNSDVDARTIGAAAS